MARTARGVVLRFAAHRFVVGVHAVKRSLCRSRTGCGFWRELCRQSGRGRMRRPHLSPQTSSHGHHQPANPHRFDAQLRRIPDSAHVHLGAVPLVVGCGVTKTPDMITNSDTYRTVAVNARLHGTAGGRPTRGAPRPAMAADSAAACVESDS